MGADIEMTIMGETADLIAPLLAQFETQYGIHVRVRLLPWDTAWSTLTRESMYGDGPDVSEIGSTWLGDMAAQQTLRPFSAEEIARIGTPDTFLPNAWQGGHLAGQPELWAMPWLTGARLLFYRRSVLEKAGIDISEAATVEGLDSVLARLQSQGIGMPWMCPTGLTHTTLLNVASWVWTKGGDFISPDGKHTLFTAPQPRAGLRAYFALGRFLAPATRHLSRSQPDEHFVYNPQVAVLMSGPWVFQNARTRWPNKAADLGVALPPGPSFVGGSYLVIWKHSRNVDAALQLIRFLVGVRAQVSYAQAVSLLPVRLAALKEPPFANDPFWQWVVKGVKSGRSLPVTRSWGLVEYRLTAAFTAIWGAVLAQPDRDPGLILDEHLRPLAQRLDPVLSGR